MISIINYGLGNLSSIENMIRHIGGNSEILSDTSLLSHASKIILPGVGAFDYGMKNLHERGWIIGLNSLILHKKVPILGICLGMQLMCKSSDEGILPGLGWIDAHVKSFDFPAGSNFKIPHMGWNTVEVLKPNAILKSTDIEQRYYFVHSYHTVCNYQKDVLATTHHGYKITAAFSHDNINGVQFHPEKSHRFGMELLKKFIEL